VQRDLPNPATQSGSVEEGHHGAVGPDETLRDFQAFPGHWQSWGNQAEEYRPSWATYSNRAQAEFALMPGE
jgi:hypothetical protein